MEVAGVLVDAFGRVREVVHAVLGDVDDALLARLPEGRGERSGNSVAWLVWHLTRVQDDHVADAFGGDQVWVAGGWGTPGRGEGAGPRRRRTEYPAALAACRDQMVECCSN